MPEPDRLLVVTHPVLAPIGHVEIMRALPASQSEAGWDHVEVAPVRTTLGDLYDLDWAAAHAAQEGVFEAHLKPLLVGRSSLAYFGFAPIPLALHLGYRVQGCLRIDVYQRHHIRQEWDWDPDEPHVTGSLLEPLNLPRHGSTDQGPLVIRVSTSSRIAPQETAEIVPRSLAEIDIALVSPHRDALETKGALGAVVREFDRGLARAKDLFPNHTTIHLFAAIPVGLAFKLGSVLNTNMFPDVVTYQYSAKRSPRYQKSIVLAENTGASIETVREVAFAPFLDAPEYQWRNSEATELYEILVKAYGTESRASQILARSGVDRTSIHFNQAARDFWTEALDEAARRKCLRDLIRCALDDSGIKAYHDRIKQFTTFR